MISRGRIGKPKPNGINTQHIIQSWSNMNWRGVVAPAADLRRLRQAEECGQWAHHITSLHHLHCLHSTARHSVIILVLRTWNHGAAGWPPDPKTLSFKYFTLLFLAPDHQTTSDEEDRLLTGLQSLNLGWGIYSSSILLYCRYLQVQNEFQYIQWWRRMLYATARNSFCCSEHFDFLRVLSTRHFFTSSHARAMKKFI